MTKTLYTGITTDLERRLNEHNTSKGAKFTRGRQWEVVASWSYPDQSSATKAEIKFKKLRRSAKQYYATWPGLWKLSA